MITDIVAYVAFSTTVELGSLTAAARKLGSSKTAISRYITRLEDIAGVKLLHRSSRKIALTASGHEFYESCGKLGQNVLELDQLIRGMSFTPSGRLRIYAPPVFQQSSLPDLVARFTAEHVDISIEFSFSNVVPDPQGFPYDIYFFVGDTVHPDLYPMSIGHYRSYIVGTQQYLDERGVPETVEDLKNHDCILQSQRPRFEVWSFKGDREIHVRGRLDSNNTVTAVAAVSNHLGLARLPEFIIKDQLNSGAFKSVLDDDLPEGQDIFIAYKPVRRLPSKMRTFISFIKQHNSQNRLFSSQITSGESLADQGDND